MQFYQTVYCCSDATANFDVLAFHHQEILVDNAPQSRAIINGCLMPLMTSLCMIKSVGSTV
jgi:hypothetical protein